MKIQIILPALILMSILFWACETQESITPSNNVTSKTYTITTFNEIEVSDVFEVYVDFTNGSPGLRIEASDNLHGVTEVDQKNGKVSISIKDKTRIKDGQTVLKVYLQANGLQSITGEGATKFYLEDTWEGSNLDLKLTGASEISGGVVCTDLDIKLTGASEAHLFGSAARLDIEATGASNFEDFDFTTDYLDADLEGACEVSITVNQKLDVKASGGSKVYYKGQGNIQDQNLSGGSAIIKAE